MNAAITFILGYGAGVATLFIMAPFLLARPVQRKPAQSDEVTITLRKRSDCEDLADGINTLIRALRWYSEGENHPSGRVASLALVEFHALATRFVNGKGGAR